MGSMRTTTPIGMEVVIAVGAGRVGEGGGANACCGATRFHAVDKVSCFSLRATAREKVDQKSIDRAPRPAVS
jgi:ribulose 1,5-bisphosphate carboxylase large subunit-like protein